MDILLTWISFCIIYLSDLDRYLYDLGIFLNLIFFRPGYLSDLDIFLTWIFFLTLISFLPGYMDIFHSKPKNFVKVKQFSVLISKKEEVIYRNIPTNSNLFAGIFWQNSTLFARILGQIIPYLVEYFRHMKPYLPEYFWQKTSYLPETWYFQIFDPYFFASTPKIYFF